jgi:2'-5' RNA ligase
MPIDDTPEATSNLRDWDDFSAKRKDIYDDVKDEITRAFPISHSGVRIDVSDVDYADPDYFDMAAQKKAILEDRSLARRLRGTLSLTDEATGQVLDQKPLTFMRVPFMTDRGTFINNGNELSSIAQFRLLPGAYTRRQESGQLETLLNTKSGTGPSMRVGFEPDTAQYRLRIKAANLHLYSLFKDLGIADEQLAKSWGPDILKTNAEKYDSRVFDKAYGYLVPKREQTPEADKPTKAAQIMAALDKARIHGRVARKNLPNMFTDKAAEWRKEAVLLEATPFDPDLGPIEVLAERVADPTTKEASEFSPDFTPDELGNEYSNLYHRTGPRLAGMKRWPDNWFSDNPDERGWLDWYSAYAGGRRGSEDQWQMNRWKRFKGKHVAAFLKNPTPRRVISLRQWGIDGIKLLPEAQQSEMQKAVEQYKADRFRAGLEETAKEASGFYEAKEAASKGCLMAYLSDPEAHAVIDWRTTNIPESDIYEPESSPHVTIAYGFGSDVTAEQVFKVIKDADIQPLKVSLGNLDMFPASDHRLESDCLWISFKEDQDLRDLRDTVLSKIDCPSDFPNYIPHICVSYVKPGKCNDLKGHGYFYEDKLRLVKLIYSEAGSQKKTEMILGE